MSQNKIPISTPSALNVYVYNIRHWEKGKVIYSSNRVSRLMRAESQADIAYILSMLVVHCGFLRNGYFYHTKFWHHSLYSLEIGEE